ncbi:MAG: SEL1-like repeat protein [Clostridia bacterium]|nr:SEL1-like repeat protein [Clostridia bacterium]
MVFLAEMYMSGEEIPRDVQKGIRYFTRAANAGDVYAMNRLAIST